ncbi:MAG: hypothetical protein MPJ22_00435 [Pirellulales bacterium]|nr:hypothetical protein [Pirellulales bacterium]
MFLSLAAIVTIVLVVQFVNNTSRKLTVTKADSTGSVEASTATTRNKSN